MSGLALHFLGGEWGRGVVISIHKVGSPKKIGLPSWKEGVGALGRPSRLVCMRQMNATRQAPSV